MYQTVQSNRRKTKNKFRAYGLKSLHILDNNISNPRYPGFSEFISSNVLRNSSYCWSLGKDPRIKDRSYKKYNDNIYNLPSLKSTRYTIQGYGMRKDFCVPGGKGSPSPNAYNIMSVFDINIKKKIGKSFGPKLNYNKTADRFKPGPGAYNSKNTSSYGNIPILLKSRQGFFYDDDLKKKKATVSMQRYKPDYKWVERRRFNGISFGIGDRPKMYALNNFPGPGTYRVPGNFDRGYRGKLPLN